MAWKRRGKAKRLPPFNDAKREFEREYASEALRRAGGEVKEAARIAGKDRKDFYNLMERTGLDPDEFRGQGGDDDAGEDDDQAAPGLQAGAPDAPVRRDVARAPADGGLRAQGPG